MNQNSNINPPNLYSLLFTDSANTHNKLSDLLEDKQSDEDFLNNNISDDNFSLLDDKLKEDRDKRLQEKDKIYKIKKHFFLKDSYEKLTSEEMTNNQYERIKEEDYLKKCHKAEQKLYDGSNLNPNDVYYILRRNYPIFNQHDKSDIDKLQRLFKAYNMVSVGSSLLLASYIRAIMLYFKFEVFKSRFLSYFFLIGYGFGIYYSLNHFVNISYVNKLSRYCVKNSDLICNYENEVMKTPYDEYEKNYNPDNKNIIDIFKI